MTDEFTNESGPMKVRESLRGFVRLAQAQDVPCVGTSIESVREGAGKADRRTAGYWVAGGLAAAAIALVVLWPGDGAAPTAPENSAPKIAVAESAPGAATLGGDAALASWAAGVRIEPPQTVSVIAPWMVRLSGSTSVTIATPEDGEQLDIEIGARVLRVQPDSQVVVAASHQTFRIERGVAAWVGGVSPPDVSDPVVRVAPEAQPQDRAETKPLGSPSALAGFAEAQMAKGHRAGAIRTLEQLVGRHPRSRQAKTGLMDLGRLYRSTGKPARARCAYMLYLERWPASSLRPDVERAIEGLGVGPQCRGLRPLR